MQRFGCLLSLSVLATCVTGCSDPGPVAEVVDVVNVNGFLTYKGEPLEGFQVTFMPEDGTRVATGLTDAAGRFVLGTNERSDGAPPGKHKIAIHWAGTEEMNSDGMGDVIDDPNKLPKPPVTIPAKYADPATSGLEQDIPRSGISDLVIDLQ